MLLKFLQQLCISTESMGSTYVCYKLPSSINVFNANGFPEKVSALNKEIRSQSDPFPSFLAFLVYSFFCAHMLFVVHSWYGVSDSVTPWTAARQASLSITSSQSLLKLMSIEWVMPSNHLILCRPLLPLYRNQYWQSYPRLRRSCATWTIKAPVWHAVMIEADHVTVLSWVKDVLWPGSQPFLRERGGQGIRETDRESERQRQRETRQTDRQTDRRI